MKETADVVIIGAGIIGLSIAFQLARRSALKIVVLEKSRNPAEGSTGASSSILRHRYTFDEMVQLAKDGISLYRNWPEYTGLAKPRAEFHQSGVLWMPGQEVPVQDTHYVPQEVSIREPIRDSHEGKVQDTHKVQDKVQDTHYVPQLPVQDTRWADIEHRRLSRLGVEVAVLDDADLVDRFPSISTCVLAPDTIAGEDHACSGGGRHLLETDAGYIDPVAAVEDLLEACRRESVDVRFGVEVTQVLAKNEKVTGIVDGTHLYLAAGWVVNAAGPWCNRFLDQIDVDFPWTLTPTRIQVLYLDRPEEVQLPIPVCVDMAGGIYFRPQNQGSQIVLGSTLIEDEREVLENPDDFNRNTDSEFENARLYALHHRIKNWPYRGRFSGYSGIYTVNQEDFHPVVGNTTVSGFIVANGFSGHGFKLAPAIGSLIAQLISGDVVSDDTGVPPGFLAVDRQPLELRSKSVLA